MKNLIYIISLLMFTNTVAQTQTNSTNIKDETKIKKTFVQQDGNIIVNKTKVNTKEIQNIKLDDADKNKVNQDIIETPVEISKTVKVDNDKDPFYDTEAKFYYYKFNNDDYIFKPDNKGYTVSIKRDDEEVLVGKAIKSLKNDYYIFMTNSENDGVGYFDEKGNFIIEYYDINNDGLLSREYLIVK